MNKDWRDELITKGAAFDALNKKKMYRPLDSDRYVISDCLNEIVNLPSAQPQDIARDIATIIENEKDMRVILKNAERSEVIRCKDCVHRPVATRANEGIYCGFSIEFPDDACLCQCDDGWYNWYPEDNWFCGYGEGREDV